MAVQALKDISTDLADFWSNLNPRMLPSTPSVKSIALVGSQMAAQAVQAGQVPFGLHGWESHAPSCSNAQISCRNTSVVHDLCCFNAPGGQMLQTQFWDANPPTGPSDAW